MDLLQSEDILLNTDNNLCAIESQVLKIILLKKELYEINKFLEALMISTKNGTLSECLEKAALMHEKIQKLF